MRATTKLLHIVIWSTLTLVGFNLHAAKEPLYEGLGSYSRKITTDSPEGTFSFFYTPHYWNQVGWTYPATNKFLVQTGAAYLYQGVAPQLPLDVEIPLLHVPRRVMTGNRIDRTR